MASGNAFLLPDERLCGHAHQQVHLAKQVGKPKINKCEKSLLRPHPTCKGEPALRLVFVSLVLALALACSQPAPTPEPTATPQPTPTPALSHPELADPSRVIKIGRLKSGATFWADEKPFLLLGCRVKIDTPAGMHLFSYYPGSFGANEADAIVFGSFPDGEPSGCYSMLVSYKGTANYCKTGFMGTSHCSKVTLRRFQAEGPNWAHKIPLETVQRFHVPGEDDQLR